MEGQITVFLPGRGCYRCLNPRPSLSEGCRSCASAGVLGPIPGLFGCLQAIEVIKLAVQRPVNEKEMFQFKNELCGRQVYLDASASVFHNFELPDKDPDCAICGLNPTIKTSRDSELDILSHEHAVASATTIASVQIPDDACISAAAYGEFMKQSSPHVLVDVRAAEQVSIVNIQDRVPSTCVWVSIPLSRFKDPSSSASATADLSAAIDKARSMDTAAAPLSVFLMCRRGVASVETTRYLLDHYNDPSVQFRNVNGGLTEWRRDVDPSVPDY